MDVLALRSDGHKCTYADRDSFPRIKLFINVGGLEVLSMHQENEFVYVSTCSPLKGNIKFKLEPNALCDMPYANMISFEIAKMFFSKNGKIMILFQGTYALTTEDNLKRELNMHVKNTDDLVWMSLVDKSFDHKEYLRILRFFGEENTLLSRLPDQLI